MLICWKIDFLNDHEWIVEDFASFVYMFDILLNQ